MKMEYLLSLTSGDPKLTFEKVRQPKTKFMTSVTQPLFLCYPMGGAMHIADKRLIETEGKANIAIRRQ